MNKMAKPTEDEVVDQPHGGKSAAGLKILHVTSALTAGGAETVMYRLISQTNGVEHEVICLGPREWYSSKLEERGIRVHHLEFQSVVSGFAGVRRLHRIIKSSDADLVQGWMYRGNILGGISSRLAGKPVIWNIRCSSIDLLPAKSRALAYIGGILARWVPDLIMNCSAVSRQLHARIGYDSAAGTVIPNGYDPATFHPDDDGRAKLRGSLGVDEDCFLVGVFGRWDPNKAYPVFLRALRQLRKRDMPLRVLFVGIGLERSNPEFASLVDRSGCADIVEGFGYRSDIPELARAIDLHVLPSLTEGFPNVVAETMLSGTPNVSTEVGDTKLIVGDTGWIVQPGNVEQLVEAMEAAYNEWSTSPARWNERRNSACARIAENFSLDRMVDAYQKNWARVAGQGGLIVS